MGDSLKSLIPKQRSLTDNETFTSFNCWREGVIFHISLDTKTARFTESGDLKAWLPTDENADRGFTNDPSAMAEDKKMTGPAKSALLNIVLGSIASQCPVISWSFITQEATSLNDIWNRLRAYYGFRRTGNRITELTDIKMESGESNEALWERLYSFMQQNLLIKDGSIKHLDKAYTQNESFTPTLLNTMVVIWLNIISPNLPAMVRQYFSTHLRENTIFSLRHEISDAIPTLLSEINDKEGKVFRSGSYGSKYQQNSGYSGSKYQQSSGSKYQQKSGYRKNVRKCSFCEVAGRPADGHYLSRCPFLPSADKDFISKIREIALYDSDEHSDSNNHRVASSYPDVNDHSTVDADKAAASVTRRVDIVSSPTLNVSVNSVPSVFTLDSGCTSNMILEVECQRIGADISKTNQRAFQADGVTPLDTVGETHFTVVRDHHTFHFSGLVVKHLDVPVLAGMPFLESNDVFVRYSTHTIYLGDCCTIKYKPDRKKGKAMRTTAYVMKALRSACILPGEKISLPLPDEIKDEEEVAIEPRCISVKDTTSTWLKCSITKPSNGRIDIVNSSNDPVMVNKHTQFCQIRPVVDAPDAAENYTPVYLPKKQPVDTMYSSLIELDPSSTLPEQVKTQFNELHRV